MCVGTTWVPDGNDPNSGSSTNANNKNGNGNVSNGNGRPTKLNGGLNGSNGNGARSNGNGYPPRMNGNGFPNGRNGVTTRRPNGNGRFANGARSNGNSFAAANGLMTTKRSYNGNGAAAANGGRGRFNGNGYSASTARPNRNGAAFNGNGAASNGNGGFRMTTRRPNNGYDSALETDTEPQPESDPEGLAEDADATADSDDALLGDDQESTAAEDDEVVGEEQAGDEDVATPSEELPAAEDPEQVSGGGKRRGPLEYDLEYMYPEMELLVKSRRKDWNYNDPEIIRAIWLEAKTHALADWKQKYVKINRKKEVKVHDNIATQLRNEHRKMKQEREQIEEASLVVGRDAPKYRELTLRTTVTAQMRYKLNRDDPPIPDSFIYHYAKYKKPPFIKSTLANDKCRQAYIGN